MILIKSDITNLPEAGLSRPITAIISADGNPQRRSWTINAKWNIREGKNQGHAELTSNWLYDALEQLSTIEKQQLQWRHGSEIITYDAALYCHQNIWHSVRRSLSDERYNQRIAGFGVRDIS